MNWQAEQINLREEWAAVRYVSFGLVDRRAHERGVVREIDPHRFSSRAEAEIWAAALNRRAPETPQKRGQPT